MAHVRQKSTQRVVGLGTVRLERYHPPQALRHLALGYPPVSRFLARFRALLRGRRRFSFDREVDGLTRPEQIVAFLALLELRKADEVAVGQAGPFDPITVWSATSAS